jgi:hypothetical protein
MKWLVRIVLKEIKVAGSGMGVGALELAAPQIKGRLGLCSKGPRRAACGRQ